MAARRSRDYYEIRRDLIVGMYEDGWLKREIADAVGLAEGGLSVELVRMRERGLVGRRREAMGGQRGPRTAELVRFAAGYVVDSETGCWLWQRGLDAHGYGRFSVASKTIPAYRFAYETYVGPVPDGLVVDHLCNTPRCVNPAHLRATTYRVNTLRGVGPTAQNARKTHCKRGHEFTPENTYVYGRARRCRICHLARRRARLEGSPGDDGASDRAAARFTQAADRTSAATPHPGRGGSLRGDRGTAPAPGDNQREGGDQ